jgi:hypothetical protein
MNRSYTSQELDDAYTVGYVAGFRTLRNTVPAVPPRPQCPADVGDQKDYLYERGLTAGADHAAHVIAAMRSR